MENKNKRQKSFIVEIKDTQNQSWQGNLTWVEEKKKVSFRSTLELIKLIDSAVSVKAAMNMYESDTDFLEEIHE